LQSRGTLAWVMLHDDAESAASLEH
jgi:hypothetical protein